MKKLTHPTVNTDETERLGFPTQGILQMLTLCRDINHGHSSYLHGDAPVSPSSPRKPVALAGSELPGQLVLAS